MMIALSGDYLGNPVATGTRICGRFGLPPLTSSYNPVLRELRCDVSIIDLRQ
jgi:hypothetical protein